MALCDSIYFLLIVSIKAISLFPENRSILAAINYIVFDATFGPNNFPALCVLPIIIVKSKKR